TAPAASAPSGASAPAPAPTPAVVPPPTPGGTRNERVVTTTPIRRTIARRLLETKQNTAMLTTFNEVDMTNVMALRAEFQEGFTKKHGIKLGYMSFFVKAVIDGLNAFPIVNAELRGNDIIYKDYNDI